MQFLNYFFASIISFLGLLMGMVLIRIAPEEQKPLEKYFILYRRILLLMIFAFLLFYYFKNFFIFFTLAVFSIFILLVEFKTRNLLRKSMLAYAILGILFFLSIQNINIFIIESSLILLYGMPTASLVCKRKEKNFHKIVFYNLGFVIVANLLYILSSYHFSFLILR